MSVLCASLASLQDMPAAYMSLRASTWDKLQAACAELQPSVPGLPHTAMFWLDRAAAAGLLAAPAAGSDALQPTWVAAAVALAARKAQSPAAGFAAPAAVPAALAAALPESAVAAHFEVSTEALLAALVALQGACGAACTTPITAYSMLELFVQVLSSGRVDYQVGGVCRSAAPGHD